MWLQKDNDLCVFAFEPNPYNVKNIKNSIHPGYYQINTNRINNSFFIMECALSDELRESVDFYCTEEDGGTSSLYKPTSFELKDITKVPVITLEYFFGYFPWDKINYIDQIKIDAQSSDFNIIKGMGDFLSERVCYLDVETSTNGQYHNYENPKDMKKYIESKGFECLSWVDDRFDGGDGKFVNQKFKNFNNISYHNF
jgi:FkbM family methyltransferase